MATIAQTFTQATIAQEGVNVAIANPQGNSKVVGYVTMTADLTHEGHFRMLKHCRKRCDFLIVGLTTDEVCEKQKRPPLFSYHHRESLLKQSKFVDSILPHNGEPKSIAWHRLQFNVCFTCAEEYLDGPEFDELRKVCPQVHVIGIPRYPYISTSTIWQNLQLRTLREMKVLTQGITGPILLVGKWVIKTINFAAEDLRHPTADNFGFFSQPHLPRNWKHLIDQKEENRRDISYPFIAGINPGRELIINEYFADQPWSLYVSHTTPCYSSGQQGCSDHLGNDSILEHSSADDSTTKEETTVLEFAHQVSNARKFPAQSVCLIMRQGGITLHHAATLLTTKQLFTVGQKVLEAIDVLREAGVLHGDIHAHNVLVDPSTLEIQIIDWGWCSAHMFHLSPQERIWLTQQLAQNWDRLHFLGSWKQDLMEQGIALPATFFCPK